MKKIILSLAIVFAGQAQAQYFNTIFGSSLNVDYNGELNLRDAKFGAGWLIKPDGEQKVYLCRFEGTGNPSNQIEYRLSNTGSAPYNKPSGTSLSKSPLSLGDMAVAGLVTVAGNSTNDFYVMKVGYNGSFISCSYYRINDYYITNVKVKYNNAGNKIYVTGTCVHNNSNDPGDIFACRIDASTMLTEWLKVYNLDEEFGDYGKDIVENLFNPNEAIIVGRSSTQGLILRVNSLTGLSPSARRYHEITASLTEFTCLEYGLDSNYPSGLVLGGNLRVNNNQDAFVMLTDAVSGGIFWSTKYDNGILQQADNSCNNIVQRVTDNCNLVEYYAVGTLHNGNDADAYITKLNHGGIPFSPGQFVYGVANNNETGNDIGIRSAGGPTILIISGTSDVANSSQYVKSVYFNGVTSCDYSLNNAPFEPGSFNQFNATVLEPTTDYVTLPQYVSVVAPGSGTKTCYSSTVSDGSNAKNTITEVRDFVEHNLVNNDDAIQIINLNQNNADAQEARLLIKLSPGSGGSYTARLTDILGRQIPCTITNTETENAVMLKAHVPNGGIYYVSINDGTQTFTKSVLIE